ncbi:MAG: hypothetical protein CM15mP57_4460 [Alphaproteobacteria bacterium]|nr:MAG: hypothetical protein CM15mP57_4460 [Alphaproteobacteria bacterium]
MVIHVVKDVNLSSSLDAKDIFGEGVDLNETGSRLVVSGMLLMEGVIQKIIVVKLCLLNLMMMILPMVVFME